MARSTDALKLTRGYPQEGLGSNVRYRVGVAQWIERLPAEEKVGGSTPLANAHKKAGGAHTHALPALLYTTTRKPPNETSTRTPCSRDSPCHPHHSEEIYDKEPLKIDN
jgi:hypothetical protein